MQVYDAMRTTFAARDYTDDAVSDETLHRILDNARFAPSGGNRQGWRVIVVKDKAVRGKLRAAMAPTIKQYKAEAGSGETPFNSINPSKVTAEAIEATSSAFPLVDELESAPVVLVVCVDLTCVSSFDKDLPRVGIISGASIYPFVWNILLSARNEGLGGVLTTFLSNQETEAKTILNLPNHFAVASMIGIGKPKKQLTKLRRKPVEEFARIDSWEGDVFRT
jgi:nitroreductase